MQAPPAPGIGNLSRSASWKRANVSRAEAGSLVNLCCTVIARTPTTQLQPLSLPKELLEYFERLIKKEKLVSRHSLGLLISQSNTTELSLNDCSYVGDDTILALAETMSQFRTISLNSCVRVSGDAVVALASASRHLTHLDLSYCSRLQCNHVAAVMAACGSLQKLAIERCVLLDGTLTVAHRTLEHLSAKVSCNLVTLELDTPHLKTLDLRDCKSLQVVDWKAPNSVLQVLNLFRCKRTRIPSMEALLSRVAHSLVELDLFSCAHITTPILATTLLKMPLLERLQLSNLEQLQDEVLASLASTCHKLRDLFLTYCERFSASQLVKLAQSCPELVTLALPTSATDECLQVLSSNCNGLLRIDLSDNRNISNQGVAALLLRCESLLSLSLCNTCIGYTAFETLEGIPRPNLHNLNLMNVPLNGQGLRLIGSSLPNLNSIDLFSNSFFEDGDLLHVIRGCPLLQELRLQFCFNVTDTTLHNIAHYARNATVVDVYGCQRISVEGVVFLAETAVRLRDVNTSLNLDASTQQRISARQIRITSSREADY